jgi:hypothetical protein
MEQRGTGLEGLELVVGLRIEATLIIKTLLRIFANLEVHTPFLHSRQPSLVGGSVHHRPSAFVPDFQLSLAF